MMLDCRSSCSGGNQPPSKNMDAAGTPSPLNTAGKLLELRERLTQQSSHSDNANASVGKNRNKADASAKLLLLCSYEKFVCMHLRFWSIYMSLWQ